MIELTKVIKKRESTTYCHIFYIILTTLTAGQHSIHELHELYICCYGCLRSRGRMPPKAYSLGTR